MIKNLYLEEELNKIKEDRENFRKNTKALNHLITAYEDTRRSYKSKELVSEEIIWEDNYKDLIKELKKAEIKSFIIANTSTELMGILAFLIDNGAEIDRTVEIQEKQDNPFSKGKIGLRINLK